MNMRKKTIDRETRETCGKVTLNLDGKGETQIRTGIGFLDHLLTLMAFHGGFDLEFQMQGDMEVDDHHIVEDAGILLGQALDRCLGDRKGISRYAFFLLPMDEVLTRVAVDISGRSGCFESFTFDRKRIGNLALENVLEFFRALVRTCPMTLHLDIVKPGNNHHQVESLFKCLGRALGEAVRETGTNAVPSTKGQLRES
jgi:imidazoleglycerol-phosphate dehydratase